MCYHRLLETPYELAIRDSVSLALFKLKVNDYA